MATTSVREHPLTADERVKMLEEDAKYRQEMLDRTVTGQKSDKLEDQPEALRSIFNGVSTSGVEVIPSLDFGLRRTVIESGLPSDLQESTVVAAGPEDFTKSRDSKVGGLVAAKTVREQSIDEAKSAVVTAPTSTQDDLKPKPEPGTKPTGGGDQIADVKTTSAAKTSTSAKK